MTKTDETHITYYEHLFVTTSILTKSSTFIYNICIKIYIYISIPQPRKTKHILAMPSPPNSHLQHPPKKNKTSTNPRCGSSYPIGSSLQVRVNSFPMFQNPKDPCMEYLPTRFTIKKTKHTNHSWIGLFYTHLMDPLMGKPPPSSLPPGWRWNAPPRLPNSPRRYFLAPPDVARPPVPLDGTGTDHWARPSVAKHKCLTSTSVGHPWAPFADP